MEVIFKVALSKGAWNETFCTSWPPGGAVWQLHTWNPLVLWVTGIWFKGGRFWAAQSRKINFFRQKLKHFESPDTLTYATAGCRASSTLMRWILNAFIAWTHFYPQELEASTQLISRGNLDIFGRWCGKMLCAAGVLVGWCLRYFTKLVLKPC